MGMAHIKAHLQVFHARVMDKRKQPLRRTQFVGDILQENLHSTFFGKYFQVLERSKGRVKSSQIVFLLGESQVQHEVTERKSLRHFDGPLDFIHRVNPPSAVEVRYGNGLASRAPPIKIGEERSMHGVKLDAVIVKPLR